MTSALAPTVLLLSTSDTDLITARESGANYRWANPSRLLIDELPELLAGVDVAVVRILGGYRAWEDGIDAVAGSGVPTVVISGEQAPDADLMERSTVPAGIAVQAHVYLAQGGVANMVNLHAFLSDTVLMTGVGFEPPESIPSWGELPRIAAEVSGPTIAVLYYRAQHLAGNTGYVDALCNAIETAGGRPLPLYCASLRTADPDLLQRLRAADAMVVTVLAAGGARPATASAGGDDDSWSVEHLAALDIPILQGLCLTSAREQWEANDDGMSPLDVATQVAVPEFDGRIITVPFSFKEVDDDGLIAYVADPERCARVAGLAVRHARLRHIAAADKKVALIFSAYPTKHARIGNAVGQFLGPVLGGLLAYWFGWRVPFLVFMVPTLILVFIAARKLKEPGRGHFERTAAGANAGTNHDGGRRGEPQRAWASNHQDGDRRNNAGSEIARDQIPAERGRKRDTEYHRHEDSGDAISQFLDGRFLALRIGNELDNLRKGCVFADFHGFHAKRAAEIQRGTIDILADRFGNRHALTGQHGFINGGAAFNHAAIDGNFLTGLDQEDMTHLHILNCNVFFPALPDNAGSLGAQIHKFFNSGTCLTAAARFKVAAQQDEGGNDSPRLEVEVMAAGEERPKAEKQGRKCPKGDERVHVGRAAQGEARHALMKFPCEAQNNERAESGLNPYANIGAGHFPRQADLQHGQQHHGGREGKGEIGAPARGLQFFSGALLVLGRKLFGKHLKAVVNDGIINSAFIHLLRIELDARRAEGKIDGRLDNTGQFLEGKLVAIGARRAVHATDFKVADARLGRMRRQLSR